MNLSVTAERTWSRGSASTARLAQAEVDGSGAEAGVVSTTGASICVDRSQARPTVSVGYGVTQKPSSGRITHHVIGKSCGGLQLAFLPALRNSVRAPLAEQEPQVSPFAATYRHDGSVVIFVIRGVAKATHGAKSVWRCGSGSPKPTHAAVAFLGAHPSKTEGAHRCTSK